MGGRPPKNGRTIAALSRRDPGQKAVKRPCKAPKRDQTRVEKVRRNTPSPNERRQSMSRTGGPKSRLTLRSKREERKGPRKGEAQGKPKTRKIPYAAWRRSQVVSPKKGAVIKHKPEGGRKVQAAGPKEKKERQKEQTMNTEIQTWRHQGGTPETYTGILHDQFLRKVGRKHGARPAEK